MPNAPARSAAPEPAPARTPADKLSAPVRAMHKLGLVRDIDLALHLPMRYVDETRITPIGSLRDGDTAQVQGVVQDCRVETRARRQLVVRLADASGELVLRLVHFYPSQQRTLAPGQHVRARGEVRAGFFGREMVHPEFRAVAPDAPLPQALTPVYPSSAQLPQAYLRKAVVSALARAPLDELLPPAIVPPGLPPLREALHALHHPSPSVPVAALEDHSHPAWQRLKCEELLAQQLSQLQAQAARAQLAAPALARSADDLAARLHAALPFALTAAQQRVVAEIEADLRAAAAHAPAAAGRCRFGQDGGGGTRRGSGHRCRLAMRADGADRDPGRAAFPQARRLVAAAGRDGGLAHRQPQGQVPLGDGRAGGVGRGNAGGGHACGDPARRGLREAGAGDRRRAAPLRRRTAAGAASEAGGPSSSSRIC